MTPSKIKDIVDSLKKGTSVCGDEDQKRAYFQGARRLIYTLYRYDIINEHQSEQLYSKIDDEVFKLLEAETNKILES